MTKLPKSARKVEKKPQTNKTQRVLAFILTKSQETFKNNFSIIFGRCLLLVLNSYSYYVNFSTLFGSAP